jgi:clathrin heavy chain
MTFRQVTMESERYICVRLADRVAVVDCAAPGAPPLWRPVTADSTLMNPASNIIALKKVVPGTVTHALQVFDIAANCKVNAHRMAAPVQFWSWLGPALMGLVTDTEVYHWSMQVRTRGEAWPDSDAARCALARRAVLRKARGL